MFTDSWFLWALLSACFAALTAIFAKVGLHGIDSDFATLIRTIIIVFVLAIIVSMLGKWQDPRQLSIKVWVFLTLSALATGASWVCYFKALQMGNASQVAPIDKLSVVLVTIFAVVFLGERPSFQEYIGIGLIATGVLTIALK
ncbi:EamA family transporter [Acinetobacter sp.]|uniref:EamA family transporter n=1 Tax=Acinetobacter sp. TaxID=472 RepID=UPI0031DC2989